MSQLENLCNTYSDQNSTEENQSKINENLYLIGFMGAGKSTVSKALQDLYGMNIVEMDQIIADRNEMSIPEIFEKYGEEYFRQEETRLLQECTSLPGQVVSCGGGVVMRQVNVDEMKKGGTVVLLSATPQTILERVQDSHDRPLLENSKTIEHISALMDKRAPAYANAADLVIETDGKSAAQICQEIFIQIQNRK